MGIVDKLTPHPPLAEKGGAGPAPSDTREPKAALTPEESGLLTRATTFIVAALKRHGIQLSPTEAPWVGAEVADFVLSEFARVKASEKEEKTPQESDT